MLVRPGPRLGEAALLIADCLVRLAAASRREAQRAGPPPRACWLGLAVASVLLLLGGPGGRQRRLVGRRVDAAGASDEAHLIVGQIRAPRTLGAWLTGALLGLAGALAQGLFRNPLADPYLLGSASGASLGVVVVLARGAHRPSSGLATRRRCWCASAWSARPSSARCAAWC